MPEKHKHHFPDARIKGIDEFLEIIRKEKEWKPEIINLDTLKTLGMAKGRESSLLYTLIFLGIIDKNGQTTEEFENLKADFKTNILRLVKTSYYLLFQTIPISRMNQSSLVRFFTLQGYSEETAEYQAKLFVRLCEVVEITLPNVEKEFKRARNQ